MKQVLFLLLAAFVLVSCVPDPREEAEAYATRTDADQRAALAEQEREQAAELHEIEMQNKRAAQDQWNTAINKVIAFAVPFVQVSVMMMVLGLGVAGVWVMMASTKAYAKYADQRADVLAHQIKIDPSTHTFPLIPVRVGQNIVALVNPNDNSVLMFDERNDADRAKVQAMANVLFAGELGHQARLSHKPGEVAQIPQAQIIDSEVK